MKILIVENDFLVAESLKDLLAQKGYDVEIMYDGYAGSEYARTGRYDLLILDVTVPELDGYELAKYIRFLRTGIPIIMLGVQPGTEERIHSLSAGADYYLARPVNTDELMVCINSLMRRKEPGSDLLSFGDIQLDLSSSLLICGDKTVRLSAKEFDIMRLLMQYKGRILSKDIILARAWDYDSNAGDNNVEVYIGFLRKKLSGICSGVKIVVARKMGYYLEVNVT